MMKLRKYVSLLLLVVYLTATGGAAYASLSCRCVTWTRSHATDTAQCTHCGGTCCAHHHSEQRRAEQSDRLFADLSAAIELIHGGLEAPCCGDRHSTEIELYTSKDDERSTRSILSVSEISPKYDIVPTPACVVSPDKTVERRAPFLSDGFLPCTGLRAPPALV